MPETARRIVVTGMGAVTPLGLSVESTWENLLAGKSGAARITYFDPSLFSTQFACELKGFDPLRYVDRKEARHMDPYSQYGIAAADEALQAAGIETKSLTDEQRERFGVIIGTGIGGFGTFQHQTEVYLRQGADRISPYCIPMLLPNMGSAMVSMRHDLRGPCHTIISACATGNDAIGDAFATIQRDEADVMVCGGAEAGIVEMGIGGFGAMKALSTRNDEPEAACRPFDRDRDGFVMGEGAGVLILEGLDHAQERGATIYAEVLGVGTAADAYHMTTPAASGQVRAMSQVLRRGGIEASQIDYINMHATATSIGDIVETQAIKQVFGEHAYRLHLSSTKSMTGHLLGAAGGIEAIFTILALRNGIVPPTINLNTPDPECDLDYTPNEPVKADLQIALSNTFGFGGHNAIAAFRRWDEESLTR